MTTNIEPHVPFSLDRPIEVTIGFDADDSAEPDWWRPAEVALELFGCFMTVGGFVVSFPILGWELNVSGSRLHVTYDRLPEDPSVLAVLVRMLLALPRPPVAIRVQGTPAASGARALPSTPSVLELVPCVRPQLAFSLEMEPGRSWLCIEVSYRGTLERAAAQLIDERLELWCKVCRAGGFSEVGAEQCVAPGEAGKYEPSVGEDSYAVEIMYDAIAIAALGVLPNLLDQLARLGMPIASVSIR